MTEPEKISPDAIARAWKEIAQPVDLPSRVPEKYRLVRPLGTGGTADVYLAEDVALKRPVALKLLKLVDPASLARFRREAMMAASLDHPNIVKIYEAGEVEGQGYIAMQYIPGVPISDRRLTLPEVLRAVQKIADALHHAHSKGMLHRDVKPGNLLVDERGEVFLTDFGLAREAQGPGVSASGAIVGTPAFMAPEQARGAFREMDARSDVYSLGATLYELVTGRPPLEGETTFVTLQNAVTGNVQAPSQINNEIPRDLEVMILKAMAPEKDRRYQSASEFSRDIGRYLSGEPIHARPPSVTYRAARFVRRRPLAVTLAAAGALTLGLAAAVYHQQRRATGAEEEALELLRRVASGATDAILTARRRGEGVQVVRDAMQRGLKDAYAEAIRRAPGLAEPDYLMGRVERALMRNDEAERYQEMALAKDPTFAPANYEMVVLLSRRYSREFAQAKRRLLGDWVVSAAGGSVEASKLRDVQDPTRDQVEASRPELARLRARIGELCLQVREPLGEGAVLSARGISAASVGDIEKARSLLKEAVRRDPLLEEAFETLAETSPTGEESERWYTEGLKHDAGYLGHWIGRGAQRSQRANRLREHQGGPIEACRRAEEDFERALALSPQCLEGWLGLGTVCINRAAYLSTRAQDPTPDLKKTIEHMTRALQIDPKHAEALIRRGGAWFNSGVFRSNRGEDPFGSFERSYDDLTRALEIDPENWQGWNWRGSLLSSRAYNRIIRGQDPTDDHTRAIADFTRVIELNKDSPDAWANRGYARAARAGRGSKNVDPVEEYRLADEDFKRSLEIYPNSPMHWTMRADVHVSMGWEGQQRAIEYYGCALEINPAFARAWARRGGVRATRAISLMSRGEEYKTEFEGAEGDLKRALELKPDEDDALGNLGRMHSHLAYTRFRSGEDPSQALERMEQAYGRSLQIKADSGEHLMGRGFGRTVTGLYKASVGIDPMPDWKRAEEDLTAALRARPDLGWALLCRGDLRFNRAEYLGRLGDSARAGREYADSAADFEQALRVNPSYERTIRQRLDQAKSRARPEY
jgi:serine/threonine-protein kinase